MTKHVATGIGLVLATILVSCGGSKKVTTVPAKEARSSLKVGAEVHSTLLPDARPVMQRKLVHGQQLFQFVVRENFPLIQREARVLSVLSSQADWKVHRTLQYQLSSDQFKAICEDIDRHAKQKNIEAVTLDYMQLVMTCVKCHQHLRNEGLVEAAEIQDLWLVFQGLPQRE